MPDALKVTPADLDTLARTLWAECRGEPLLGQQAVAWVIRNRALNPGWWTWHKSMKLKPVRITAVGGACLSPMQFSCWNMIPPTEIDLAQARATDNVGLFRDDTIEPVNQAAFRIISLPIDDPEYVKMFEVGRAVMAGEINDPTNGCTHYKVIGVTAEWAKNRAPDFVEGHHEFYRLGKSG